jgi:hypothetical protein
MRVAFAMSNGKPTVSKNSKTGPIYVSSTEMDSCPDRCPFKGDCYASAGHTILNWRKIAHKGQVWADFVATVAALPARVLWRHNEAGDLPTLPDRVTLDRDAILALAFASAKNGKRGFTYTHHALTASNVQTLQLANAAGFTINVSCETADQADLARSYGLPAVIVVPKGERPAKGEITAKGAPIRSCPAETTDLQCATCGICARSDRSTVIAFEAHGALAKRIGVAIRSVAQREALDGVAR